MYRCAKVGECTDVTLGDCLLQDEYITMIFPVSDDWTVCQNTCALFADCNTFRYNGTTCVLLKEDYRQECKNSAAPFVSLMS